MRGKRIGTVCLNMDLELGFEALPHPRTKFMMSVDIGGDLQPNTRDARLQFLKL